MPRVSRDGASLYYEYETPGATVRQVGTARPSNRSSTGVSNRRFATYFATRVVPGRSLSMPSIPMGVEDEDDARVEVRVAGREGVDGTAQREAADAQTEDAVGEGRFEIRLGAAATVRSGEELLNGPETAGPSSLLR